MHIAVESSKASIWVTTGDNGVSYAEIEVSSLNGTNHPKTTSGVPLLPAGQGGGIAGYLGPSGSNAVFVSDKKNQMSYFEQAADTKMWKQTPFWFPSLEKTLQIHCWMTRIVVSDTQGAIVPKSWVKLTSTGMVSVVINGVPVTLDSMPLSLQTDDEGAINIVNPTNDISSYQFKVTEVYDAENKNRIPLAQAQSIDPMAKLDRTLSNMTADRLSTATTVDGESVFENKKKEDLDTAVEALKEIAKAKADLQNTGSVKIEAAATIAKTAMVVKSQAVATKSVGDIFGTIKNVLWEAWHYVVAAWDKVKGWAIETYSK